MPGPDMAAADPGGAFPEGSKPCRACSDFKQWAKIGPGIPEITSLFKLIIRPSLTGVATPASEQSKQHSVPQKEPSAPEVPEDQDRAVTDHQLGVCPPDRQVPNFRRLSLGFT